MHILLGDCIAISLVVHYSRKHLFGMTLEVRLDEYVLSDDIGRVFFSGSIRELTIINKCV